MTALAPCPVTLLRIGNVAGADALLGPRAPRLRSCWIRFRAARVARCGRGSGPERWRWCCIALARSMLPPVLNLACDPPLADGRSADGQRPALALWPANPAVVPVATLSVQRLAALCRSAHRRLPALRPSGRLGARGAGMTLAKRLFDIALGADSGVNPRDSHAAYHRSGCCSAQGRPVFYLSERMRTPDRAFRLWKFRTMTVATGRFRRVGRRQGAAHHAGRPLSAQAPGWTRFRSFGTC